MKKIIIFLCSSILLLSACTISFKTENEDTLVEVAQDASMNSSNFKGFLVMKYIQNDEYKLTMKSEKEQYRIGEEIKVSATLEYIGKNDVPPYLPFHHPIDFQVVDLERKIEFYNIYKMIGLASDNSLLNEVDFKVPANYDKNYYTEKELNILSTGQLPAGNYEIKANAMFLSKESLATTINIIIIK